MIHYRLLNPGETTRPGDEAYLNGWHPVRVGSMVLSDIPIRRPEESNRISLIDSIERYMREQTMPQSTLQEWRAWQGRLTRAGDGIMFEAELVQFCNWLALDCGHPYQVASRIISALYNGSRADK